MARDYGMSEQPAVEESASRMNEAPPAAMTVESVTIRPVENGFVVSCAKRAAGGGGGPSEYQPPKEYAFNSSQEALRYAAQELGGTLAEEQEPADASELMA
jgi:hypothetical protein